MYKTMKLINEEGVLLQAEQVRDAQQMKQCL
jgi:hypothetical protein